MSNSFATPWTIPHQSLLSMGFSKQEYWSKLPFLPAGDLPDSGIQPASLAPPTLAGTFFTTASPGKPKVTVRGGQKGNIVAGSSLNTLAHRVPWVDTHSLFVLRQQRTRKFKTIYNPIIFTLYSHFQPYFPSSRWEKQDFAIAQESSKMSNP